MWMVNQIEICFVGIVKVSYSFSLNPGKVWFDLAGTSITNGAPMCLKLLSFLPIIHGLSHPAWMCLWHLSRWMMTQGSSRCSYQTSHSGSVLCPWTLHHQPLVLLVLIWESPCCHPQTLYPQQNLARTWKWTVRLSLKTCTQWVCSDSLPLTASDECVCCHIVTSSYI